MKTVLRSLSVYQLQWLAGRSEPFLEVEDIREDIPEGLWDSIEKRIEAIDKPNFTHEIKVFDFALGVNVESNGILELKERSFKVLDADVNKQYIISKNTFRRNQI